MRRPNPGAHVVTLRPTRSASGSCATRSSTARASSSRERARVQRSSRCWPRLCVRRTARGLAMSGEQALRRARPIRRLASSSVALLVLGGRARRHSATRLPHPCGVSAQALCVCALSLRRTPRGPAAAAAAGPRRCGSPSRPRRPAAQHAPARSRLHARRARAARRWCAPPPSRDATRKGASWKRRCAAAAPAASTHNPLRHAVPMVCLRAATSAGASARSSASTATCRTASWSGCVLGARGAHADRGADTCPAGQDTRDD